MALVVVLQRAPVLMLPWSALPLILIFVVRIMRGVQVRWLVSQRVSSFAPLTMLSVLLLLHSIQRSKEPGMLPSGLGAHETLFVLTSTVTRFGTTRCVCRWVTVLGCQSWVLGEVAVQPP